MLAGGDAATVPGIAAARLAGRQTFSRAIGYRALGDDGLLSAVVKELEREGFRVIGADQLLDEALVPEGPLGRISPDARCARRHRARACALARALGALDIGQAVVVQQGLVLGVEAIEGTDALAARAVPHCAATARAGCWSRSKSPARSAAPTGRRSARKPSQRAAASGLRGIAVEAGATLVARPRPR